MISEADQRLFPSRDGTYPVSPGYTYRRFNLCLALGFSALSYAARLMWRCFLPPVFAHFSGQSDSVEGFGYHPADAGSGLSLKERAGLLLYWRVGRILLKDCDPG
jgi:hypothetical protein